MATLCLNLDAGCEAPELRDWLAGDWALLFSHPEDFNDGGLEADRWLDIHRDEFRARRTRPLALQRQCGTRDLSWVGKLFGEWGLVRLAEPAVTTAGAVPLAAHSLRAQLLASPPRCVTLIDEALQRRAVLKYAVGRNTVCPLDLLASIDAMRRPTTVRRAA